MQSITAFFHLIPPMTLIPDQRYQPPFSSESVSTHQTHPKTPDQTHQNPIFCRFVKHVGQRSLRGSPWESANGGDASGDCWSRIGEQRGEEAADAVEALLVFPVAALDLAVVSGRVRADEFVTYAQGSGGGFKERMGIAR